MFLASHITPLQFKEQITTEQLPVAIDVHGLRTLSIPISLVERYSLYRLHHNRTSPFVGIPVLFIHGHRGHFTQGGALAYQSDLLAARFPSHAPLDWYSIDFTEVCAHWGSLIPCGTESNFRNQVLSTWMFFKPKPFLLMSASKPC